MKWPFVSRHGFDMLMLAYQEAREQTRQAEKRVSEVESHRQEWSRMAADADNRLQQYEQRFDREMVRAETRYADLMASYRLLRLQGFTDPAAVPKPQEQPKPDPIILAINRASRGDPDLRRQMLAQVDRDRKANPDMTDVELVDRINRGNRPAEEVQ